MTDLLEFFAFMAFPFWIVSTYYQLPLMLPYDILKELNRYQNGHKQQAIKSITWRSLVMLAYICYTVFLIAYIFGI